MSDHDHGTSQPHSHAQGHSHSHAAHANSRAVGLAALLTGGFMLVELLGGYVSGSLALIADAGHMLTDFAALGMAWLAFRLGRRPADARRTYGFDRLSVLAAFVNGLALFVVAIFIVIEAFHRVSDPESIKGGLMLLVATAGLLVNIASFWILTRADRDNLNMRAAILHVAGDLLGSVAAMIAALVILWTGWMPIDPILSVLVALLILRSALSVVRDSAHILLEGSPTGFDAAAVATDLAAHVEGLARVRHIHAWLITEERPMVTLEAVLRPGAAADATRRAIKARLAERFDLTHTTIEICAEPGPESQARLPKAEPEPI